MFETVLDVNTAPSWFVNFFIDFNVKVDLEKLEKYNVAYASEKEGDAERQAACILNPDTNVVYIVAKQTTYDDPVTPEIQTFLFETNLNRLNGKTKED